MAAASNNWISVMRSDEEDSESSESDFHYSDSEEDSDYSGYLFSDISEVDFEIKVFQDVTMFLDQFDKLKLEEEIKSAAKKTEHPTLNNKNVSEDKMETNKAEEENKEDLIADSETLGEDRKTEDILPGDSLPPCSSNNQVRNSLLLLLLLLLFLLLLLLFLQERKRFRDSHWFEKEQGDSKRLRQGEPGDVYHADTEDSDED